MSRTERNDLSSSGARPLGPYETAYEVIRGYDAAPAARRAASVPPVMVAARREEDVPPVRIAR